MLEVASGNIRNGDRMYGVSNRADASSVWQTRVAEERKPYEIHLPYVSQHFSFPDFCRKGVGRS